MTAITASPHFSGADYVHARDCKRLTGQLLDIYKLMRDGKPRTLAEISAVTGHGEASISAQLRNLRKPKFGAHAVGRDYLGGGLYNYWLKRNPNAPMA